MNQNLNTYHLIQYPLRKSHSLHISKNGTQTSAPHSKQPQQDLLYLNHLHKVVFINCLYDTLPIIDNMKHLVSSVCR